MCVYVKRNEIDHEHEKKERSKKFYTGRKRSRIYEKLLAFLKISNRNERMKKEYFSK